TRLIGETVVDLIADPKLIAAAKQELIKSQGPAFHYEALLGDREPPLDYRN
ncbi:MAG: aminobenzoyl-glutamate utilization protein B, partial [Candidatus Azotimanducaceae bacterium]